MVYFNPYLFHPQTWQDITMDFITHLPLAAGQTNIWVIVYRFSKTAHFFALPTNLGAVTLASLLPHNIYKLHGIPKKHSLEL